MAARPTWKGYLKISLVNIPIKVFPATDAGATLSFNQLHGECQTRIQQKRWCPKCEREVPNTDIVKGFEFEKGRYVVVDEEDIEKVRVDSTRVINLEKFTDDTAIDPIYLERPYYLAPDGPVAREAFAVIREGMKGKAGIGKVALYGREYLVKVQPREQGLVMYTLRHASEIRSMEAIDELADMPGTVKPDEVKLAQAGDGHVRRRRRSAGIPRRLPGRAARDHRRQDRRPRGGRAGSRGAAEGGQPDGRAAQEPRLDWRQEEAGRRAPAIDREEAEEGLGGAGGWGLGAVSYEKTSSASRRAPHFCLLTRRGAAAGADARRDGRGLLRVRDARRSAFLARRIDDRVRGDDGRSETESAAQRDLVGAGRWLARADGVDDGAAVVELPALEP